MTCRGELTLLRGILLLPLLASFIESAASLLSPRDDGDFSPKSEQAEGREREEAALKRRGNSGEHGRGRRRVINQKLGCRGPGDLREQAGREG